MSIVLASASPRRRELMEMLGVRDLKIIPAKGEERAPEGLNPAELVKALSAAKAREVAARCGEEDIVIGAAECMGVTLEENFRQPFFADSCSDLWRRWHISLNSWFRDYVYIPLGGNRKGQARKYLNILIVFTLSGMWHGADITFIIWGMLSGLFQIVEDGIAPYRARFPKWLKISITFLLFTFAVCFFRADDIGQAMTVIGRVFTAFDFASILTTSPFALGLGVFHFLFLLAGLAVLLVYDIINERTGDTAGKIASCKAPVRWTIYFVLVLMILGSTSIGAQEFIYFKF